MKSLEVRFSVGGWVKQTIEVDDDVTPEQLQELLNNGKALTSIEEEGYVILLADDAKKWLGRVTSIENNCEYTDFEVEVEN